MSSVPGLCFNRVSVDGSALHQSQVARTVPRNVLCKLPADVARKVLSSFLDLADIVRLDSATLVHSCRESFQHMYQGNIVANAAILKVDFSTAEWLLSRMVYVQNMQISQRLIEERPNDCCCMMRETATVVIEPKSALYSSKMSAILGNCPRLTSLGLSSCTFAADLLSAVMSLCPLLQKVYLAYTNVDSTIVAPLLSPQIVSLDLCGCSRVDDATVMTVTAACTNLQTLNLDNCRSCTRVSLDSIARHCPQLQSLSLEMWTCLSDESVAVLAAGCRDLRSLRFEGSEVLTSAGVCAIAARCTKLVNVALGGCEHVEASAIVALVSSCPELRSVNIQADDAVVVALSQHCPHLTDVSVSTIWNDAIQGYGDFKGESLAALLRNCQKLRWLSVSDFSSLPPCSDGITSSTEVLNLSCALRVDDQAVSSMLLYMPRLHKLCLFGGFRLTDATVLTAANHCPLLDNADLCGLMLLTDVSIIALAQRCPLLRKINLSGCTLLTDAAVIAIAERCPQLTHVTIHNYQVRQSVIRKNGNAVNDIPSNLEPVEYVRAYPETFISDASIAALAAHSHRLRELDTQGHAHVSQAALDALAAALPRCTIIKY